MKNCLIYTAIILSLFLTDCDVQSGMTKKSLEKYETTPTPEKAATPAEEPINPTDIVTVDATLQSPQISINKPETKKIFDCSKYNRVVINADQKEITIKGACKQIMLNGDKNRVTAAAVSEIVLNGFENSVTYSKYANGKKPFVTDSGTGNTVSKAESTPAK